jgi:xanthine dehydrogenase accessory factor
VDTVLIRGGGEMATGVAATLYRAGMRVVVTEVAQPRAIRRTVAYAEAVPRGRVRVESIEARCVTADEVGDCWREDVIPVVIDPGASIRQILEIDVLVDALVSKTNAGGTGTDWAPLVIGLGPGFVAGQDCHLVIETQRGHFLGRVYDRGSAEPDTGVPGELGGHSVRRVLRSPAAGVLATHKEIGATITEGEIVASVDGAELKAPLGGVLRGLIADGTTVAAGDKVGDIDPRGRPEYCHFISDKARHIGQSVLAAILWHRAGRPAPLPVPPRP